MEKPTTETWVTPVNRPVAQNPNSCLVHIYPTGSQMGMRYMLNDRALTIGRGEASDIRIHDHSVSRKHAMIELAPQGVMLTDLGSTNGTFVNDVQIHRPVSLHDGDYIRVGNCIYRFLAGGNVEAEYHEEIYRLTIIDALTQLHNHRFMMEFLERELIRSHRHGRPLAMVMMDIDWFKNINDQYGHLAGDFALRELANCIKTVVRREDLFARYGGEEFGLVLVETQREQAIEVAERIRKRIAEHTFRFEDNEFRVTVSMGICAVTGVEALTAQEVIRRADEKLYQAKAAGRNRVVA